MAGKWKPKAIEQPDGSFLFELRNEVFLHLRPHSPTKIQAQLWRQERLLPPDTGNLASKGFRDGLVKSAQDAFNEPEERNADGNVAKPAKVNVPHVAEDINTVAAILGVPGADGKSIEERLQEKEGPSLAEQLVSFAEEHAEFFHTPAKDAHATVQRNGHTETWPVESRGFRLWLKGEFRRYAREKAERSAIAARERYAEQMGPLAKEDGGPIEIARPPMLRAQIVADALGELESFAINDGAEHEVHLRTAKGPGGKYYIDLCNEEWQAVEIDEDGWRVIKDPPVKFVRSNTMQPLPVPTRGGSVEDLSEILTLDLEDKDNRAAWRLILAWLIQSLRPQGGQYPILVLLGGQGSAKTNTGRFLRRLVDPSVVKDTSPPKQEHDLYIRGLNSWVISLDNISTLPHWLSDAICRIATEGGFATRKLYSGREEEVFDALRPFILNGIADVATRPDILDRSLLINLPVIKKRRSLRRVKAEFEEKQPGILGALFDAMSEGLKADLDEIEGEAQLPRLADFATWAIATEQALGGFDGSFLEAYKNSRGEATATALEAEPIVYALLQFAHAYSEDRPWQGTTKALLERLNEKESDDALRRSAEWPKTPRGLSELLKRLAPALIETGVFIAKAQGSRRAGRQILVYSATSPEPSPGTKDAGDGGGEDADTTVTTTVTNEKPIYKPNSRNGDGGDGGDGTQTYSEEEKDAIEF